MRVVKVGPGISADHLQEVLDGVFEARFPHAAKSSAKRSSQPSGPAVVEKIRLSGKGLGLEKQLAGSIFAVACWVPCPRLPWGMFPERTRHMATQAWPWHPLYLVVEPLLAAGCFTC